MAAYIDEERAAGRSVDDVAPFLSGLSGVDDVSAVRAIAMTTRRLSSPGSSVVEAFIRSLDLRGEYADRVRSRFGETTPTAAQLRDYLDELRVCVPVEDRVRREILDARSRRFVSSEHGERDALATLEEMLAANPDDEDLATWLRGARPGDVRTGIVTVTCVEALS